MFKLNFYQSLTKHFKVSQSSSKNHVMSYHNTLIIKDQQKILDNALTIKIFNFLRYYTHHQNINTYT